MLHADRIAQLRAQRGLSQRGLGRKLGKDAQYISKLERGVRQIVLSTTLEQLALALACSTDYLLNLTDDPHQARPPQDALAPAAPGRTTQATARIQALRARLERALPYPTAEEA